MVQITNTVGVTTALTSALQIDYVGGAAAIESSAVRIDLTPGGTTGGTWNAFRVAANTTGPATGVIENGLNIEGPTNAFVGTFNAITVNSNPSTSPGSGGVLVGLNFEAKAAAGAGTEYGIRFNDSNWDTHIYGDLGLDLDVASGQVITIGTTIDAAKTISIGNAATAATINIGNGTTGSRVVFAQQTAAPTDNAANGSMLVGAVGTTALSGRIWVRANNRWFRFNSLSNVADFSEFIAQSEPSEQGDVMVVDTDNVQKVRKSRGTYEQNILGVITVTGTGYNTDECADEVSCDRANDPNWANVGMLGQIAVKVTTENGSIQPGDRLTTSSIPGVAMKATEAGQIIGRALDPYTASDPTAVGKVKTLVSPSYFSPETEDMGNENIEQLRIDSGNIDPYTTQVPYAKEGNAIQASNFGKFSIQSLVGGTIKNLGKFVTVVAANLKAGMIQSEEVVADRVLANHAAFGDIVGSQAVVDSLTVGVITPDESGAIKVKLGTDGKVSILDTSQNEVFSVDAAGNGYFAGTITADKIKVNQIEGLDLTSLLFSGLTTSSSSGTTIQVPGVNGVTFVGDLIASGSSTFTGPALFSELVTFIKNLIVQGQVTINGSLKVLGDVIFGGHLTVNTDTAGVAVIPSSSMSVDVPFEKPFSETPIVTITLVLSEATDSAFLAEGVRAAVANVTTNSFSIVLAEPVPRNLTYNWFALAVIGGRRIVGKGVDGTGTTSTLLVTPTPDILGATVTPSASLTPTVTPVPTPEASPSASLTPTVTPVPTPTPQ